MRATWSFYDSATGLFTGRRKTLPHERLLEINTPAGCAAIRGAYDKLSQRVDVETGKVIDYQPPKPNDDHEWRENVVNGRPRWVKKAEVVDRERRYVTAKREIDALERSQMRSIRELMLDSNNAEAKKRIAEIDAAIAEKRKELQ